MKPSTPLARKLAAEIRRDGPISLSSMLVRALHDPEHGFYTRAQPFGAEGHFVTAPEVSQMFGELLGVWAVTCWDQLGRPESFDLIELGPGRGTLMTDLLRAARIEPAFSRAARVVLVEASARLQAEQAARLEGLTTPVFRGSLAACNQGRPFVLIGNEFLDCLGVRQFVRDTEGWRELRLGLGADGELVIGLEAGPALPAEDIGSPEAGALAGLPPGTLIETSPATAMLIAELCARLQQVSGYALFIDYGSAGEGRTGSSLQAVQRHAKVDVLATLGEADLTHHVDFAAICAQCTQTEGIKSLGPVSQERFLRALGIDQRLAALVHKTPSAAQMLQRQYARLVAPDEMGTLFKAIALQSAGLPEPAGFP